MQRDDLLKTVKLVAPALGTEANSKDAPVLTHLCFSGKSVTAYDNYAALYAPCDLPLKACVPGDTLISMLDRMRAKEVTASIEEDGVSALFKAGRVRLTLGILPTTDALFSRPKIGDTMSAAMNDDLVDALGLAARSGGINSAFPSRSGITMAFGRRSVSLYSTDDAVVFKKTVKIDQKGLAGRSFILPPRFYSLLLSMSGVGEVLFTEEGNIGAMGDGVELYSREIKGADPDKYDATLRMGLADKKICYADVPTLLLKMLQRAVLINPEWSEIVYSDGRLSLNTVGRGSRLQESVKIDLGDVSMKVRTGAAYLLRYLDRSKRIGISPMCVVLGDDFNVLIAVRDVAYD